MRVMLHAPSGATDLTLILTAVAAVVLVAVAAGLLLWRRRAHGRA